MRSNTLPSDEVIAIGLNSGGELAGIGFGIGVIFTMHHWRGVKLQVKQALNSVFKTPLRYRFAFLRSFGLNSSGPAVQILSFSMLSATLVKLNRLGAAHVVSTINCEKLACLLFYQTLQNFSFNSLTCSAVADWLAGLRVRFISFHQFLSELLNLL